MYQIKVYCYFFFLSFLKWCSAFVFFNCQSFSFQPVKILLARFNLSLSQKHTWSIHFTVFFFLTFAWFSCNSCGILDDFACVYAEMEYIYFCRLWKVLYRKPKRVGCDWYFWNGHEPSPGNVLFWISTFSYLVLSSFNHLKFKTLSTHCQVCLLWTFGLQGGVLSMLHHLPST